MKTLTTVDDGNETADAITSGLSPLDGHSNDRRDKTIYP